MITHLDFERPIADLENKIAELKHLSGSEDIDIVQEIQRMQSKAEKLLMQTYSKLTPWQKVQVARHPNRPHFTDIAAKLVQDFTPLSGDRTFGEDRAIMGGFARFHGQSVVIMGHEKGHDTESRIRHNFGMAKPEGYRKAKRLMELADQFGLPLITLVDTAGAYPGLDAEERGQAEAIAKCLEQSMSLKIPYVCVVVGEGGSGGAIAIATANHVHMLEHAVYSVITPEGCASILWRSASRAQDAALAQKLTAQDLKGFGIIDDIIQEPLGGAHRNHTITASEIDKVLVKSFTELGRLDGKGLLNHRREKFLKIGRTL